MSLLINDIFGAIYAKYAATAALTSLTASATSMYLSQAPFGAQWPFIVVTFVSWVPSYVLGTSEFGPREDARVQFGVFSQERHPTVLGQIVDALDDAYGALATALSFSPTTSYAQLRGTQRQLMTGPEFDGKTWSMFVEYLMRFDTLT